MVGLFVARRFVVGRFVVGLFGAALWCRGVGTCQSGVGGRDFAESLPRVGASHLSYDCCQPLSP